MEALFASEFVTQKKNLWNQFTDRLLDKIEDTQMWTNAAMVLGRIVLIIIVSRLALMLLGRFIDHVTSERETSRLKLRTRRVQTLGKLLKNTAVYTVNFIVILLVLGEFNIQLAPLLAGAGVIGLAIGFGAQSLVKDVITGFFIILEDQFAVGDVIQTGNFKGTVELIGLRATRIKNWTGEIHIIPNGSIVEVTNFSVNNAIAVVDVNIAYEEQVSQAMDIVRSVLPKLEDSNIVGVPELLGIQTMNAAGIALRITVECRPNSQAAVTRKINEEIKRVFEENGIAAPYQRMMTIQRGDLVDRTGGA
ncbi:mechanosensitive ion channel family protein [Cohnella yongneupensis]|uniref:Mechanosensitive ion channel family protein n=1 Tax=Cohnella yongneupensis TaxID=425006 RepID=A0ABW0QXN3_9BACL